MRACSPSGSGFPVNRSWSCATQSFGPLSGEPEEGWISFTYKFFHSYPVSGSGVFPKKAASYARGAYVYLNVLQFFFDEERKAVPFDPFNDFALLGEEEYQSCDRAGE